MSVSLQHRQVLPTTGPVRPKEGAPPQVEPRLRLLLRPMLRVRRISLFEREVRERLSRAALDLVFAARRHHVRGAALGRATGARSFFGSTMLTIELDAAGGGPARRLRRPLGPAAGGAAGHATPAPRRASSAIAGRGGRTPVGGPPAQR